MNNLKDILTAIEQQTIEYGINKQYCFVTDEDGELVFLKRNDKMSAHQKDLDADGEQRNQWPENSYDGEIIWTQYTGEQRGLIITEMFLNALQIEYQG